MEKQKKIGFFKKIYMSVFKLEDYSQILEEKKSNAFKYFCLLCVIVTLIFSVFSTIDFGHKFDKAYSFFKTIPEFEYNNGVIKNEVYSYGYDEEYSLLFVMDTSKEYVNKEETEKVLKENYKNMYLDSINTIFMYKSSLVVFENGNSAELKYSDVLDKQNIINLKSSDIINTADTLGKNGIIAFAYLGCFIINFYSLFLEFLLDIIMLAIFAEIVGALVCGIQILFKEGFAFACHAITLPMIIFLIYSITNFYTGFYMEYFSNMIVIIEYVYIVAIMFIIKSDRQKLKEELAIVENVHQEVIKELSNKNENNKDKEEKADKEDKEENSEIVNEEDKEVVEEKNQEIDNNENEINQSDESTIEVDKVEDEENKDKNNSNEN